MTGAGTKAPLDAALSSKVQHILDEVVRRESVEIALAHPVLLSPYWLAALQETNPAPETQRVLAALAKTAERLRTGAWPLGAGPLDALFVQVQEGAMAAAKALAIAASADYTWRVSPAYVRRMSAAAERWAREGKWRDGVLLARLVLALLDARREVMVVDQAAMDLVATVHWLDIATRAVCDVPDGRIFRDAVARGERLAGVLEDPDGYYFPAAILHGLGILHLDPYVGGRTNVNYKVQLAAWRDRFRLALQAENEFYDEKTMGMPAPEEAVVRAADYLRRAAVHRSDEPRGWTLKALTQALVWHWELGAVPPTGEAERVGAEAMALLNAPDQAGVRAEIDNLLRWDARKRGADATPASSTVDHDDVETLLRTPLAHWLAKMSPEDVLARYVQTASRVEASDPLAAFALWDAAQPLGWQQGEEQRMQFCQYGINMLAQAYPLGASAAAGDAIAVAFARLRTSQEPDEATRAAKLLALVGHASARNEEGAALPIFAAARAADAAFADHHAHFLGMVHANLLRGEAVNKFKADTLDAAVSLYMDSAQAFLACGCPVMAFDGLECVVDLVDRGSERALAHFVAGIGGIAAPLEQALPGVTEQLQVFYRKLMAYIVRSGTAKPIVLLLLAEAAKGSAFARALVGGTPLAWLAADAAKEMEARLAELTSAGVVAAEPDSKAALDYELILSAYATPMERAGGDTDAERLRNLRIVFEAALVRAQVEQGERPSWLATDTAVQEALGPRSALLAMFIGHVPSGDLAIFLILITSDSFDLAIGQAPGLATNQMTMEDRGQRLAITPFAPWVAGVREAIQEDPLTRKVSAKGARMLQSAQDMLLGGGLVKKLDALRASGRDHLYVWPHGPFHFFPLHLVGAENDPLAARWNVTYLPSLLLLDPSRRHEAPIAPFVAVGLDFPNGNARGLSALAGAEDEARDVTKAMAGPPALVGNAATEAAVVAALGTHKRIHIASHGELPVSSPAFQTLYLSADALSSDLHAYEILRLDLRGVDLVTLSACETALGRIDVGDNLRGFAANLLIAGVSTIIGTLWRVETNCARFFFVRLYEAIHADKAKGEAFKIAQAATRTRYPQYRDWGAFYLTGAIA